MKTIFMKQVLPVAVFAFAIAGAFTTHAMNERSKTFAQVEGFIKLDPNGDECEERDECSTVNNGIVCRVGYSPAGAQLYAKNSADKCTVPVYRP
jgi:hypothetical protein